ncbi:MAG: DUF2258 domain-containing protein [Thermoprotei archaeon]|nr:MAG: DUF2258 domain-containing protein [Thermoprotei archaeon]
MPTLNTGLIIAGAYADKARRVLMAQVKGVVSPQEAVRAVGELNKVLFEILVNELKADKGDVVRVVVDYEVQDGQLKWNYNTLKLEFFKRVSDEEVNKQVKEALSRILSS